jgi:alpha/beta superfamily hydrolase
VSGPVLVPGPRDVRARLDGDADGPVVVACPPDPRDGGSRADARLRAVSDALADRGVGCLRLDYGPWAGGEAAVRDARAAVAWAHDRADRVALAGYSLGGAVALAAAADAPVARVAALAPPATADGVDAAAAVARVDAPGQVVVAARDRRADAAPVVAAARERGWVVEAVDAGHGFGGSLAAVAGLVAAFLD